MLFTLFHVLCQINIFEFEFEFSSNGECGKFPPSVHCHISVLTYYHRLLTMSKGKVVKSVFKALYNLNDQGFQTWITRVSELARRYGIDINETASIGSVQFKSMCSNMIKQNFVNKWHAEINNRPNTTIETYALYKPQYVSEKYLDLISNPKYRIAVSKLRASSHNLEIERGCYTRPKVNPENRLCPLRYVVDNEIHFVVRCRINETLRVTLWNKINATDSGFAYLDDKNKFCYLMSCCDRNQSLQNLVVILLWSWSLDTGWTMWPWPLTSPMTLTFDFSR